jgi:L-ascorbate metabolism protein UlaG (beta-lactamase superfamily)
MKITYYGHSCLGITCNGYHLLIDPFITPNPKASAIDIDNIKADYILITHAHYDHVMDVELFAEKTRASLIANFEIVTYYAQKNLSGHW